MIRMKCAFLLAAVLLQKLHAQEKWFEKMDIGPAWMNTFGDYFQGKKRADAIKGLSVDLGDGWRALYDTETLRLVSVYKGEIEWGGTPWTGAHGEIITLANQDALLVTSTGNGWADAEGSFADKREIKGHGNIPNGKFTGHFRHGREVVVAYTMNGTEVLETLSREGETITRSFKFGAREKSLLLHVADGKDPFAVAGDAAHQQGEEGLSVAVTEGVELSTAPDNGGRLLARIPSGDGEIVAQLAFKIGGRPVPATKPDFKKLISGGSGLWTEILSTEGKISGNKEKPYVSDLVTIPTENPWGANLRFGGFDFIDADSAALSTWNGDVWVVRGLRGDWKKFRWQRIASGLFEPLGLRVVGGVIYVNGRDQITRLIDLNGDGETDHYDVFNRDVLVTSNFHEFAFDLQTDREGNFYFSKAAPVRGGGRGFDKILPHHGIVAKVSPDGKLFEVVATGLRAPGGLGIGPNGEITTGENEGTWQPCCKINFLNPKDAPAFFGTEDSRHNLTHRPFLEPLVYLPMDVDNSGGSQVWIPDGAKFGLNTGEMIHLSYGKSSLYRVLPVVNDGKLQGGVVKLPISLKSSAMRARFHEDGSLYVLGFRGWQTNAATECAFQRVRHNESVNVGIPEKLEYMGNGIRLTFPEKIDAELAVDPTSYSAQRWDYVRGPQYGSGEFSVDNPDKEGRENALTAESKNVRNRDTAKISTAKLSPDAKTVDLVIEGMKPSMSLKVSYDLEGADEEILKGEVYATVRGK